MIWGVIGSVWYGKISTTGDTIWSQLFVGASESVAEAAVQLSLLDIWFEHQNGFTLGMYTMATAIGTYVGPLIGSQIADSSLGWRWIGYWGAIISAGTFLVLYFGLEETEFQRDRYLINNGDRYLMDGHVPEKTLQHASDGSPTDVENNNGTHDHAFLEEKKEEEQRRRSSPQRHKMSMSYTKEKTYWQRIKPITTAHNLQGIGAKQFVNRLWHTMRVFSFPAVWFGGLQWGLQNVCLTFYLTVEEDNWYGEPWNYTDTEVGNMNIPCLIGGVIGAALAGWGSDKFVIWMTKRNKGVWEAEFRLYLMIMCLLIFPTGMWVFGIGSAKGWNWPAPYVGLGFIGFGYGCAGDLSITYLADSYPDMILEGMVGVATINNTLAMIFTFVASYWIDSSLRNCFIELGVISFIIMALSLPMIIFGKRARRWTRERYMKFLELRDGLSK